eukprot:jgi/Ulvmu1/6671/UM030_0002.1
MTLSAAVDFIPGHIRILDQAHAAGSNVVSTRNKAITTSASSHNLQHCIQAPAPPVPVPTSAAHEHDCGPADTGLPFYSPCGMHSDQPLPSADPFWTWLNDYDDTAAHAADSPDCSDLTDTAMDAQLLQPLPPVANALPACNPAATGHAGIAADWSNASAQQRAPGAAPAAMGMMPGFVMAGPPPWPTPCSGGRIPDGRFVPWGQQFSIPSGATLGCSAASAAAAAAASWYVPRTLLPQGSCEVGAAVAARREKWSKLKARRAAAEGSTHAVRYEKRKRSAEMRPRVQGRFVRRMPTLGSDGAAIAN